MEGWRSLAAGGGDGRKSASYEWRIASNEFGGKARRHGAGCARNPLGIGGCRLGIGPERNPARIFHAHEEAARS